ncbi:MAG TPA: 4-hydroxy-3-methylbut-2-enyl diphosphate reductase [Candidatus Dormibacteraeota bacterium]|nr:4-hydroxy-3-methylbut-2-enyl diphosphate reductase [Candidatus Dormibacteraeota bacterium]
MGTESRRILLANPRGFCAGVDRAIQIIEDLLDVHPGTLYVRKEIVHNRDVVERLRGRGVVFVDELAEVPNDSLAVFSAHGVAPDVRRQAAERNLRVVDATCPLVTKVHVEALRFARDGYFVLLIGHAGHDEVTGTLGQIPGSIALVENEVDAATVAVPDPQRVAVVTQTTLSLDDTHGILAALKRRFPALKEPPSSDICYATQNRQNAVKELAVACDVVLVVGSQNSSNAQRLRDCSAEAGTPAYLIDGPNEIERAWIAHATTIGVTAGASTPEHLVARVVEHVRAIVGDADVEEFGKREPTIVFAPPRELAGIIASGE